ncbi:MAG TPA: hypothetical protein ENN73_05040 [Firmicutes bacterium]|nr:hypothetical protein [Bacillota bacterium]
MDLSKKRKKLAGVFKEYDKLKTVFMTRVPMLNGGIYKTKTKCGNPNCHCNVRGELHEVWRYYYCESGKNKIKTLKIHEIGRFKELTERYKKFRRGRILLVKLHKEILELIDKIEQSLIKD